MRFRSLRCPGSSPSAFQPFLGLSATASRHLVNVEHLWNLDSLLRILDLVLVAWCRQRRSERLLLRSSDVSEARRVLASHVAHEGTRRHPLWVDSFLTRCGSALFHTFLTLVLVKAAGDFLLFSSVRRACTTPLMALHELASWRTVRSHTFLHVLRVASWSDQHHFVSSSLLCVHVALMLTSAR